MLIEFQLKVPIETMIITATSAGIGTPADKGSENSEQEQEERARYERRQAAASARGHIDYRLADHRAAAHATEEGGNDIRAALARAFPALVAIGVCHVIDDLGGEQALQQADRGHGEGIGENDPQRFERERHVGNGEE